MRATCDFFATFFALPQDTWKRRARGRGPSRFSPRASPFRAALLFRGTAISSGPSSLALVRSRWGRFLAGRLSSVELIFFALAMFVLAPPAMKFRLVAHLVQHPSGAYMIDAYLGRSGNGAEAEANLAAQGPLAAAGAAAAAAVSTQELPLA